MPLGTLDRTPPPFFRQGPSAVTKLAVCAALALFLMVADARFTVVAPLADEFQHCRIAQIARLQAVDRAVDAIVLPVLEPRENQQQFPDGGISAEQGE